MLKKYTNCCNTLGSSGTTTAVHSFIRAPITSVINDLPASNCAGLPKRQARVGGGWPKTNVVEASKLRIIKLFILDAAGGFWSKVRTARLVLKLLDHCSNPERGSGNKKPGPGPKIRRPQIRIQESNPGFRCRKFYNWTKKKKKKKTLELVTASFFLFFSFFPFLLFLFFFLLVKCFKCSQLKFSHK